jgi:histidyl-tRNA synthetase
MPPSDQPQSPGKTHSFQAPKGTRDYYPQDLLRRRYIEKMWRDTAIRHGFEEIDGPTFEHLDLYTVKSGEGIVSELFSFRRDGGEKDYALRPEFTPTLARMYAAKAGSLPKPTKWFWQQNCFRAERPQRGRLREFGQWNVDLIGGEVEPTAQAELDLGILATVVGLLAALGLTSDACRIRVGHRRWLEDFSHQFGIPSDRHTSFVELLDQRAKLPSAVFNQRWNEIGLDNDALAFFDTLTRDWPTRDPREVLQEQRTLLQHATSDRADRQTDVLEEMDRLLGLSTELGIYDWLRVDCSIARGLAYYTGMVFEVHEAGGKERAIAGGGRYDKLIEMFGGPPTPAVGFGMGDVVLSLVLQDRGLMPEGQALLDKLSEPPASLRPDVFVISNGQPESDAALRPLVAQLRRGGSSSRPLHARQTYKTTKNVGKLLQEASGCHARFAAIIENATEVTLKNLGTGQQDKVPLTAVGERVCGA